MKIVLGLILSLAVLAGGGIAMLFVLVAMTGSDLSSRADVLMLWGCMGAVAALVVVGLWLAWRLALR
ncbi:MAG: hypothetical protein FJX72_13420 [Armatimonadetes bacterium]|nr:hypothetical protein [Armatimonadota bacterium]